MTPSLQKHSRLDELEWLICNETDRAQRAAAITEYHNLYEEIHGRGSNHGSREACVRAIPSHQ
ncbi:MULTISPECIES: hypothetical protein [unclassified Rhizobium]|uniref:hypothetical protein n=1 Tax=unclassified Rhizobium TaxID=2613769 RepID=UPI0012E3F270|nr:MULTISPECIES: hypothetical protein [unclassified Rhizobium]